MAELPDWFIELKEMLGERSAALTAERAELRQRWPGLKAGGGANEVFHRMVSVLEHEPTPAFVRENIKGLRRHGWVNLVEAAQILHTDTLSVEAYVYFAELLHLIIRGPRGLFHYRVINQQSPALPGEKTTPAAIAWKP